MKLFAAKVSNRKNVHLLHKGNVDDNKNEQQKEHTHKCSSSLREIECIETNEKADNEDTRKTNPRKRKEHTIRFSSEDVEIIPNHTYVSNQKDGANRCHDHFALWYSPREIQHMLASMIITVKRREDYGDVLPLHSTTIEKLVVCKDEEKEAERIDLQAMRIRFSPHERKRRRIARKQIYETCQAIQEFESSTNTKQGELLSNLLRLKTEPMVNEAIKEASRIATDIAHPCTYASSSTNSSFQEADHNAKGLVDGNTTTTMVSISSASSLSSCYSSSSSFSNDSYTFRIANESFISLP